MAGIGLIVLGIMILYAALQGKGTPQAPPRNGYADWAARDRAAADYMAANILLDAGATPENFLLMGGLAQAGYFGRPDVPDEEDYEEEEWYEPDDYV